MNDDYKLLYLKQVVADWAISVITEYKHGRYHGREVSQMLSNAFEALNDTVEKELMNGRQEKQHTGLGHKDEQVET